MPELKTHFDVYCGTCEKALCGHTTVDDNKVHVEACPDCVEQATDEGYEKGIEEGEKKGYDKGWADGLGEDNE